MTLYVVLGAGTMPTKEVAHQLDDLWKKCEEEDTDFWFALEGKPKGSVTETDLALVEYFNKYGIHYGAFAVEGSQPSDEYVDVAEYFDVDSLPSGVLALMNPVKKEGEESVILALFTDDEDKDEVLIDTIALALQDGFKVYGLNDAMEPVELLSEEVKPLPEETIEEKPKASLPVPEEVEDDDEPEPLNQQYLESLTANEVKEIARGMGLPTGTKAETIATILDSTTEPVTPVTVPSVPEDRQTEHQFDAVSDSDNEAVLVVVHTPQGMTTIWTTMSKVKNL